MSDRQRVEGRKTRHKNDPHSNTPNSSAQLRPFSIADGRPPGVWFIPQYNLSIVNLDGCILLTRLLFLHSVAANQGRQLGYTVYFNLWSSLFCSVQLRLEWDLMSGSSRNTACPLIFVSSACSHVSIVSPSYMLIDTYAYRHWSTSSHPKAVWATRKLVDLGQQYPPLLLLGCCDKVLNPVGYAVIPYVWMVVHSCDCI